MTASQGYPGLESEALSPKEGVMFERRHLDMKLFSLKTSHAQTCKYTPMHVHPHIYTHALRMDKLVEWNGLSGSLVGARQIFSKNLACQAERGGNGNPERAVDNKVTCSGCPAEVPATVRTWRRKKKRKTELF